MLINQRHDQILSIVNARGRVGVKELSEALNVSEPTIRRDLALLAREGLLIRVHGGAVRNKALPPEPPLWNGQHERSAQKQLIGCAAARLIESGETVFLGSGTTVLEVTAALKARQDLERVTVITNSIPVVNMLINEQRFSLILVGGFVRHEEHSAVGWIAEATLRDLRADKVIIGIGGVDLENGLLSAHVAEVMTDRAILSMGSEVIVVADSSKFGRREAVRLAPLSVIHTIVTDEGTPDEVLVNLRSQRINVVVARASQS